MHLTADHLILSATDLSAFLACEHLAKLRQREARGGPSPPKYDDPSIEVLQARGLEHEQRFLAQLEARGRTIGRIEQDKTLPLDQRWTQAAERTLAALRSGADVVHQGVLFDGTWLGLPDFLVRINEPSELGEWSYEVVDAKLTREAKGGAVLQISLYSDLLGRVQGRTPEYMRLALGGPKAREETYRVADFAAYYRFVRRRFEEVLPEYELDADTAPEPVEHCRICQWKPVCDRQRHEADHLSLVAGIAKRHRRRLTERGVTTLTSLATLELPVRPRLEGITDVAIERVREQARIQHEGRRAGEPRYEFLTPVVPEQGFAALPPPSPGDLFFDLEGDPYAFDEGLEYLFGFLDRDGQYVGCWALNRADEKGMFELFIDTVMERLDRHPDLHIYHYAAYEVTAVKKLMGRHATREDEVDRLLRGGVFVDLFRVVRQGLRASVESYSIKKMEPFYDFERRVDLRNATSALKSFEAWLQLGQRGKDDMALLDQIQGYNRDDCLSTLRLAEWLEDLRGRLCEEIGEDVPRPKVRETDPSEEVSEAQARTNELVAELTADVPADPADRSAEQQARWLLAQLLGWHRREDKSMWWEYYRLLGLTDEERQEDRSALGGLEYVGVQAQVKRSLIHRYRFPPQDHRFGSRTDPIDPATEAKAGTIHAIDDDAGTIDLRRAARSEAPHPTSLIPLEYFRPGELEESLFRIAESTIDEGLGAHPAYRAAADLLLAHPPRLGQPLGSNLTGNGEDTLSAARRLAGQLDHTVLPIQGPPGAGKTYTGARMIVSLLTAGKRVGITALSHKAIGNLLDEVCLAAGEEGVAVRGMQKAGAKQRCASQQIETGDNPEIVAGLTEGALNLAAGTSWLWSRPEMMGTVDVLFIDEAGQFSLANALAVAPSAESLVLLGDPRQLEQPQRGVHPPGADASALDHLLRGDATVSPDRGLFLPHTWRMHPDVCEFSSELFYQGRLGSRPELSRQRVNGPEPLDGSGLRFVPVVHEGNRSESVEEVDALDAVFRRLTDGSHSWTDAGGEEHRIGLADVLVVAPYNAQVGALKARLPDGARVGTVDKFQGQEAPVVIYSMATSSPEDAPRGMEFLYSPNRLNVAISRARCLAIVVGSPALLGPECRSPRQMQLANAFCRFAELATITEAKYGAQPGDPSSTNGLR